MPISGGIGSTSIQTETQAEEDPERTFIERMERLTGIAVAVKLTHIVYNTVPGTMHAY